MSKLFNYFPQNIKKILIKITLRPGVEIQEIRLRVNRPLEVITSCDKFFLQKNGNKADSNYQQAYTVSREELKQAVILVSNNSLYAVERQLKEGFITLPGGHRVGFTGEVVTDKQKIKTIKNINSLNYRFTSEVIGAGNKVLPCLLTDNRKFINTLLISPPLCGKTTLLRDLVRTLSTGSEKLSFQGLRVGVVDERSEIGGACRGVPGNDLGLRTDLLDNCPKVEGMMLLIRSMSPEVIAVDEIGGKREVTALREAGRAGVGLLATIHGSSLQDVRQRPGMKPVMAGQLFKRIIVLSRRQGPGTVEKIQDREGRELKK